MIGLLSHSNLVIVIGSFDVLINILLAWVFALPLKYIKNNITTERFVTFALLIAEIFCILGMAVSLLMVMGVLKKCYKFLIPYLYFRVIGMIGTGLVFINICAVMLWTHIPYIAYILPIGIAFEALQLLFWIPVYKLYKKWYFNTDEPSILTQTYGSTSNVFPATSP